MKSNILTVIITIFAIIFMPIGCLSSDISANNALNVSANSPKVEGQTTYFKVLRTESEKIENISVTDYLCGVLAAEMPASYEKEALKAQAVAAYTFALYRKEHTDQKYDVTDNYKTDQAFTPLEKAQEKWGENAAEYTAIIKSAVAAVGGMRLTYNGETALTVYHAISNGKTSSAKEVWGKDVPYLVSVDSALDKTAPTYISTLTLSVSELKEKLKDLCTISADGKNAFKSIEKTASGRVGEIVVEQAKLSGGDIQTALSLRSASFDVSNTNGSYHFTVYGYGHGVGMSQNGANEMAKQGSTFEEILYHYYKGTKIKT